MAGRRYRPEGHRQAAQGSGAYRGLVAGALRDPSRRCFGPFAAQHVKILNSGCFPGQKPIALVYSADGFYHCTTGAD